LQEAVNDAVEAVEPLARGKAHVLRVELDEDDLWVNGDKARLVQVISNLLTNAVKFTPSGGRIIAKLSREQAHAQLSIRDTGIGIPRSALKEIFEPFVQGDQDIARSAGGLGLGLSLVQQIVALHGGEVSAFSARELGQGSEFVVRLPLVVKPSESQVDAPALGRAASRRILVVDDNRDAANTMRAIARALGHHADVAFDGETAFQAMKSGHHDAVLLDIGLPGLSGLEVAKKVRAEISGAPRLIAISGYGQDSDRDAALQAGFDAYLTKPVDVAELSKLLGELLS
jgi:CheY-like chemotaxis protein